MNALLALPWPFSQSVVERLGWVLIHSLWQFTIVALLAALAARALRRHSAATRYGVFAVAMSVSVAAALATWMLLPGEVFAPVASRVTLDPHPSASDAIDPMAGPVAPNKAAPLANDTESVVPTPNLAPSTVTSPAAPGMSLPVPASSQPAVAWSELAKSAIRPWMAWIVAAWGIGVAVCSVRPLLGWHTLRRLRRVGVSPASDEVLAAMRRVSERLGVRRAVGVLQSTVARVPMVIDYVRPVVLLPLSLATSIPAAQLEAILAHELTHVRRHDFVVNLLQTLVETLFFYHPSVWWLSRQIRLEREHCCDDQVVKLLDNRVEYGRALVAIEELRGRNMVLALGATDGPLISRVRRIVGVTPDRTSTCLSARWPVAFVGLVTLGLVVTIALATTEGQPKSDDGKSNDGDNQQDTPSGEQRMAKELELLRGFWAVDSCDSEAATLNVSDWDEQRWRWTIKGQEIVWGREGQQWRLMFKIDPAKTPKQIHLSFLNGPHEGERCLGIYDWVGKDGKDLKIVFQDPGAKVGRPTSVARQAGSQTSQITLRPIPPIDPAKELALWQGTWCWDFSQPWTWPQPIGVGTDSDGRKSEKRWVVEGNQITWVGQDGERVYVNFTIDPFKAPKQIEFNFLNGPLQGKKSIGIYESRDDEDHRELSMTDPGSDVPRPTYISGSSIAKHSMIVIHRVVPPPERSVAKELKRLQGPSKPSDAEWELSALQGTWTLRNFITGNFNENKDPSSWPIPGGKGPDKSGEGSELRWVVKDRGITWTSRSGEEIKASFKINTTQRPKQIDLTFLSGPDKGETCLGIYQRDDLNENILWLCLADPDSNSDRPQEFSYKWGAGRSLLSFYPFESSAAQSSTEPKSKATVESDPVPEKREAVTADAANRTQNDLKKELALWQGTWSWDLSQLWTWPQPIGVGTDSRATRKSEKRWTVKENQITWISQEGRRINVEFTIDPTKTPKQIEFTFLNGPLHGKKSVGIYAAKSDEDHRHLCMTDPGSDAPRPTDFSAGTFLKQSIIVIHRVAPPPKPTVAQAIERLQGVWQMTLCDSMTDAFGATQQEAKQWQWSIKGDQILWSRQNQRWKMKLEVDPSKSPNEIDLTYLDGPYQGNKCQGMYVFGGVDGQSLMISIQDPGSDAPRPTSISMSGGVMTSLIFLRPSKLSDTERELGSFQGTWTLRNFDTDFGSWPLPSGKGPDEYGEGSELRWTVKGNEITWTSRTGEETRASFKIDPMKSPKQFDLTFLNGPYKGQTCLGIYQRGDHDPGIYQRGDLLDENNLWLCIADPDSATVRPTNFSYKSTEGRSLLSLYPFEPPAAQTSDSKPKDGAKLEPGMEERLRWGEPANGLRAAVAIRPAPAEPNIAVEQEIYLVVQNVSDGPIRFSDTTTAPELRKLYLKHDGVPQSATVVDKPTMTDVMLQPRGVAYLRMFPSSSKGTSGHTRGALLATILMTSSHQSVVAHLQIKQAPSGAWTGTLVTGDTTYAAAGAGEPRRAPLEFRVAANPAESDIEPRVPKDFLQRHYRDNTTEGGAAAKDQGFIWVPLAMPRDGRVELPVEGVHGEQRHALLGDTADTSLVLDGERRAVTSEAVPDQSQPNHWSIHVKLNEAAGDALRRLTKMHLNQKLAIVVEGKVIAAPVIRSEIGKAVMISGDFSKDDAERLAQLLLKQDKEIQSNDREAKTQTLHKPALLLPDHWIVNSVGFDNGGKELVAASQQGAATIRRWDVAGRKLVSEIKLLSPKPGLGFQQGSLKLSHECRRVLAITDEFAGLWDATTGELLKQLPAPKVGENDTIYMLDATPDFSTIVGSLGTAYETTALMYDAHSVVWDGATGAVRRTLTHTNGTRTTAMTLSPDGNWLATTNGYGVRVWDVSNGELVRAIENDNGSRPDDKGAESIYRNHVWSLKFSPDGKELAIIDGLGLKLVDPQSGKPRQRLEGGYHYSSRPSPPLVFSRDGQRIARLGTGVKEPNGYVIPIWSTQTGQKLFELHTNANDACFSNDGQQLAVGFSDLQFALSVWNLSSDAKDAEPAGPGPHSRQNRVEENGHYRGKTAAEFIDKFKPIWSEPKLGIQYGIAFTKQPAQFRSGERVPLVFFFRNASNKPLKLDMRPDYYGNNPKVLNVKREAVNLANVALLGDAAHYVEMLQPGESVGPFYASFGLGENPLPGKQHWHPFLKSPQVGKYTLTHTVSINVSDAKDGAPVSRETITSDSLSFEIVD